MDAEWYGVRCLFSHGESRLVPGAKVYEERIVLLRASSLDDAIEKAESEAQQYADALDGVRVVEFAQAYAIPDDPAQGGGEVFSLMRSSSLDPEAYVDRFFDSGPEHEQKGGA
jgi:hypothetical protein